MPASPSDRPRSEYPDVGCAGGGSTFAGLALPFVGEKLRQGRKTRILAVEPEACPTLTRGSYGYDLAGRLRRHVFEAAIQFARGERFVAAPAPA